MFGFLEKIKTRLSHISASSWHYKLVKEYGLFLGPQGKACTYYWVKVPVSLIIVGGMLSLYVLFAGFIGWLLGFYLSDIPPQGRKAKEKLSHIHESRELYYPHNVTPWGWKQPVAPWKPILLVGILALLYYLIAVDPETGVSWLSSIGGFVTSTIVGVGVIYLLWKIFDAIRSSKKVRDFFNNACPDLVIKP